MLCPADGIVCSCEKEGSADSCCHMDTPSKHDAETSLVVQWLRLHAPNAEGPGPIPDQGT